MFQALLLEKSEAGFSATIRELDESQLPDADVTVAIEYSSLNFKDGLAITNRSPVVRSWPMVAGIDGAGTVIESRHARFKVGDRVVHNGWGVGETRWGCLAQRARLPGDGLVHLPAAFSTRQAMAIGTAGYTAMLCVLALEDHGLKAGDGEVLVTGATGGVGSVAVALLAKLGHKVVAATGKAAEAPDLMALRRGPSWFGRSRDLGRGHDAAPPFALRGVVARACHGVLEGRGVESHRLFQSSRYGHGGHDGPSSWRKTARSPFGGKRG